MLRRKYLFLIAIGLIAVPATFTRSAIAQTPSAPDTIKAALDGGDYAGAERLAGKALAQHPGSSALLVELGMAQQMQGRSTAAIQVFEQALRKRHDPRVYALLAEERCKTRDLDGSRPMLARILRENATDSLILAIVAPCYLEMEQPIEAVQVYDTLLLAPAFPHDLALVQLSRAYLSAAQFFFKRLITLPGSEIYRSAIEDAKEGRSPNARGAFERAASSSGFRPDASYSETMLAWREHPDDPALVYLLAVLSSESSIRQVELCSEGFPDSPYLDQLRLEVLVQQNRNEEAEAGYGDLLRTHPEIPDLKYNLGMLYRKQRQWYEAAAVFQEEVKRNPLDERSAARLSESLEKLGRWAEIKELLVSRTQQVDLPLWASIDLAEAEDKLGEARAAIGILKAAEATHMSSTEIHFRLSRLYKQTGDVADAKAEVLWLQTSFARTPH